MRPGLRFDVFKRDAFTCRYCGRQSPSVILELDHVVPRAEGGQDELENLVTSCFECNRGKGVKSLDSLPTEADVHEKAILIAEREMQVRELNEARRAQRERENEEIEWLASIWAMRWPARSCVQVGTLRHFLQHQSVYDLADRMEWIATQHNIVREFHGWAAFCSATYKRIGGKSAEDA